MSPDSLVPFLYYEKSLYKPDHQQAAMEWLALSLLQIFQFLMRTSIWQKSFMIRITQFKDHFSYLFIQKSQAPLQINVINITNDLEVVRGIFQWMLKEIDRTGIENLKSVEVTLYKDEMQKVHLTFMQERKQLRNLRKGNV